MKLSATSRSDIFRIKLIPWSLTTLCLVSLPVRGDDRFFPVTDKTRLEATSLGIPSCNEKADIVFRLITASQRSIRVVFGSDQLQATESAVLPTETVRTSTGTLSAFPTINASGQVLTYNLSSGVQIIQRMDRTGPNSYASQAIARAEASQTPPNPFSFVSPIGGLADNGVTFFYGERTPLGQSTLLKAIYSSSTEITAPATVTPLASSSAGYSTLDSYVACASNGAFATWRGTGASGLGIYASNGHPGAVASAGFMNTGSRPSINALGHLALAATFTPPGGTPVDGVFIRQLDGVLRRAGNLSQGQEVLNSIGIMPASYPPNALDRVALNDFGQVMFIALDILGRRTLYTTGLGRCRPLLAIGDQIQLGGINEEVASIALFDGLKKNGQGIFWVSTVSGNEFVLRSIRGFTQAKLKDSPFLPSYQGTKYLLRSIPAQEARLNAHLIPPRHKIPSGTIKAFGCNLVSTANLLTAYGHNVSPGELQNWLLQRWASPPPGRSPAAYIKYSTNDLSETSVELYSSENQLVFPSPPAVRFINTHNPKAAGALSNFQRLISELRQGYPVKVRVPNGGSGTKKYDAWGHYVLAYGIKDPGKAASLVPADILIHDPGNGGIYTFGDYGSLLPAAPPFNYNSTHPNWLEDEGRLHIYRPLPPGVLPSPTLALNLAVQPAASAGAGAAAREVAGARARFLLTDSQGRRQGTGPDGTEYSEIPNASYFVDEPYSGLDGDEGENDVAWEGFLQRHTINLQDLPPGQYSITITAVDRITYAMSAGSTGLASSLAEQESTLAAGQSFTTSFSMGTTLPPVESPQLAIERPDSMNARLSLYGKTGSTYKLKSSSNLQQWTDVGTNRPGANAALEWTVPITLAEKLYYRVEISTP